VQTCCKPAADISEIRITVYTCEQPYGVYNQYPGIFDTAGRKLGIAHHFFVDGFLKLRQVLLPYIMWNKYKLKVVWRPVDVGCQEGFIFRPGTTGYQA
jgi:hypothetical protein